MNRRSLLALVGGPLVLTHQLHAQPALPRTHTPEPTSPQITEEDLKTRLYLLADDSLNGRAAGSRGDYVAATYIAGEFRRLGLEAAGDSGSYFQTVPMPRRQRSASGWPARNVIAILRGSDPTLRREYVVLSAHNDHIGVLPTAVDHDSLRAANAARARGGAGSASPIVNVDSLHRLRPARADSIANGADDDASGTAALLEIAELVANAPTRPKRSLLFVSHTAEELGLVGSRWFTDHPTVPRGAIMAELDMDMIGRGAPQDIAGGGPQYLELVGARRLSKELGALVEEVNRAQPTPFQINYAIDAPGHPDQDYCRADHFSYARYGIPALNFSRGEHGDYHEVSDEAQYIDYPDLARVTAYVSDLARRLADLDHRLVVDAPRPGSDGAVCAVRGCQASGVRCRRTCTRHPTPHTRRQNFNIASRDSRPLSPT